MRITAKTANKTIFEREKNVEKEYFSKKGKKAMATTKNKKITRRKRVYTIKGMKTYIYDIPNTYTLYLFTHIQMQS